MRCYVAFLVMHIKSQIQYRLSFFLLFVSQFIGTWFTFLSISFLFARFDCVGGFSYEEVLLCFSVVNFSFYFSKCLSEGFHDFSSIISNTEFDRILTRPRYTILQVLFAKLELHQLGAVLQSTILLIYAIVKSNFIWDTQKAFVLVAMLMAGICIFLSLSILYASFCFFTIDGLHIIDLCIAGGQEFGRYPVAIYGQNVLAFFTYVVPIALFQYYPLLYLIGKDSGSINAYLPLCCPLFTLPCIIMWNLGVRNYKSVGS